MGNLISVSSLTKKRAAKAATPVYDLSGKYIGDRVVDVLDIPEGYAHYYTNEKVGLGGHEVELPEGRKLDWYDIIGSNTSAGKDSQAQQWLLWNEAKALGIEDRLIAIHADLGDDAEWPDTGDFAKAQAEHLGMAFAMVSRVGTVSEGGARLNKDTGKKNPALYAKGETRGGILAQVLARYSQFQVIADQLDEMGKPEEAEKWRNKVAWPDAQNRWCTKDFKTSPVYALYTQLAAAWREANPELAKTRPCRILNCLGIRGQESGPRTKKPTFKHEDKASSGNRHIDTWHPIKWWTNEKVWATIKESGAPHHWAYDMGMPRLSCSFCVMARKSSLMIAGKLLPEKLDKHIEVEEAIGSTFQMGGGSWDGSLKAIKAAIEAGEEVGVVEDWAD